MEYKGYKVTTVRGTLRYMKVGERGFKSPSTVPEDVKDYFENQPTTQPINEPVLEGSSEPQTTPPELEATDEEVEEAYKQMKEYQEQSAKESVAELQDKVQPFTDLELELLEETETLRMKVEELERQENAVLSLEELAKQLYIHYGVYTLWCGEQPREGDTHPFTANRMSRYDTGIAYRAQKYAVASGSIKNDVKAQKESTEQGRAARQIHKEEMESEKTQPGFQTFEERTSVHGGNKQSATYMKSRQNDPISEDPTQEPNLYSQTIRPYW